MTSEQQRTALHSQIWKIANEVRGAIDGWNFKEYVLGTLFYRFISEHIQNHLNEGLSANDVKYENREKEDLATEIIENTTKELGYFIYPNQLFVNVVKNSATNDDLNTDLAEIFKSIEASAIGYQSEDAIKGLFADFDTTHNRLGNTVQAKNQRLCAVLKGVANLEFGDFNNSKIDLFGDAYEFLISNYAANAGKSGGEYFTPQNVASLLAQLVVHNQQTINKVYDPACGSGSLLLQVKKNFTNYNIKQGYYGQELNHTTYNLARINMFLHSIDYNKFNIQLGDTLTDPKFIEDKPFDAIVSNPPYSVKWQGSDDPTLINDPRFSPAGVLAPKSKADFAFVLHTLNYLSTKGRAAVVCFPGIFYRGGAEAKIRQYLIDNNYIESLIALPPNLFFGTSIAVTILVLAKNKPNTNTLFINASGADFYKKETNNNIMQPNHITNIVNLFANKQNIDYVCKNVTYDDIVKNDYNLSVSTYVQAKDTSEKVDITQLNNQLNQTVENINNLRAQINAIVKEIESE